MIAMARTIQTFLASSHACQIILHSVKDNLNTHQFAQELHKGLVLFFEAQDDTPYETSYPAANEVKWYYGGGNETLPEDYGHLRLP
jgi:hypothetical protein